MAGRKSRKFIGELYGDEPIFLVFKHEKDKNENSLVSEGPFKEIEKAEHLMRSLLVEGVCAWMVSYNGREG